VTGTALAFRSLTPDRWGDFEAFFRAAKRDEAGNPNGCWCMEWRLPRQQWEEGSGEANRLAMKRLVDSGAIPGILAYEGPRVVGWCSVSPREKFRLRQRGIVRFQERDDSVWSIMCFYLPAEHRGKGIMSALLRAAVDHAASNGARVVEGYPVDPRVFPALAYTGLIPSFEKAGFSPVDRPIEGMTVMQRRVG
jgi:GNAT superfamily N-acetyltransferase